MATFKLANQSFVFLMVGAFSVSILMFISPGYAEGFHDSDELLGNDDSKDFNGWMQKIEEVMEDNKRMKNDMAAMKNQILEMDSMRNQTEQQIMNMKQLIDDNRFKIKDIDEKPRFVAEIRSTPQGTYLPTGDIKDYDELIDVGDNFNPSTGVFTVGSNEEDEGTYVFQYSCYKNGDSGMEGHIYVMNNIEGIVQGFYEEDRSSLQMNGISSFNLKSGSQINLYNVQFGESIFVANGYPFIFTGFKI